MVGTSEQVAKNVLRSVYDKIGVSDRLELALFVLHHKTLAQAAARSIFIISLLALLVLPRPTSSCLQPSSLGCPRRRRLLLASSAL